MSPVQTPSIHPSSFRDPSGFLFQKDGVLYRHVGQGYQRHYDRLVSSGLYQSLTQLGWLVPHSEVRVDSPSPATVYKTIEPQKLPFISYPYEWSFNQLKDAALMTIRILKKSLEHGMVLKDASAYNIQFYKGKPLLIDTLSFEEYEEGCPWLAYQQFCRHFLAPLSLMAYKDVRLGQLLKIYLDGIPLDLANSLLPMHAKWNLSVYSHICLHAKSQRFFSHKNVKTKEWKLSKQSLLNLADNLEETALSLRWKYPESEWGAYTDETPYAEEAFSYKKEIVSQFFSRCGARSVWDMGGNNGLFSRIASSQGMDAVCFDLDPVAVDKNYLQCVREKEANVLPLILDLTNPSPSLGWNHEERMSLAKRGPTDVVLALALIHHLAISNNVPFSRLAEFFASLGEHLIIEFVPKDDPKVQQLLTARKDIFCQYTESFFKESFSRYFDVIESMPIRDSKRTIFLMKRNNRFYG